MENILFHRFLNRDAATAYECASVPEEILTKYKGEFVAEKDEGFDCLHEIWKSAGFCAYKNGLYSLVNPDDYTNTARRFSGVPDTAIVFAKSGIGCLFLWDKVKFGESIFYLNVHKNELSIVSTSFLVFFGVSIGAENWWKDNCYGKTELKAVEKHGPISYDECCTFLPALVLGGNEDVTAMKKVKVKENLELLAQLHGAD